MGLDDEWLDWQARGWRPQAGHVCAGCVDDYALAAAVQAAAVPAQPCRFCGSSPAAELDVLLAAFMDGVWSEYGDADDEGVGWDGREGGYQWGRTWDSWDLVDEFADVLVGEGLLDAVRGAVVDRTWVEQNFAWPRRDEALAAGWAEFCDTVQHKTRYVFFLRDHGEEEERARYTGEVPASRFLDELGDLVRDLDVLVELPAGSRLWRARAHAEAAVTWGAGELGTAPREHAKQANRMSPAGIPMFYGADDLDTAIAEVAVRGAGDWATAGRFETSRSCTVVDLTGLPPVPSMFDAARRHRRRTLLFLHEFVEQLRQPAREAYEQVDYVPTQVVTEYLLRVFAEGQLVRGLRYPSALTGHPSVVLDVPHRDCVEQEPGWRDGDRLRLGLVPGSVTRRQSLDPAPRAGVGPTGPGWAVTAAAPGARALSLGPKVGLRRPLAGTRRSWRGVSAATVRD